MRKINENDYVSFTISKGWNLTVNEWKTALKEWNNLTSGTLYGNKPDGPAQSLIPSKTTQKAIRHYDD